MSVKGKLKVCRVEYETKDRTNWKASIIAYNMDDAIEYIKKNVKDFDKYVSTSIITDIDAIETKAFNDFFVDNTKVVETQVSSDESNPDDVICPWCDKEFKNKNTLATHIKKFHME
ncbi:MAG: C2H2-type zinc finger protein [Candidatus Peribacteraceae bacterium]|nr:C2H2-type zinc finger protein [Candidatus Peribacteraceae bacterium]